MVYCCILYLKSILLHLMIAVWNMIRICPEDQMNITLDAACLEEVSELLKYI